jgi:hypothetical protein
MAHACCQSSHAPRTSDVFGCCTCTGSLRLRTLSLVLRSCLIQFLVRSTCVDNQPTWLSQVVQLRVEICSKRTCRLASLAVAARARLASPCVVLRYFVLLQKDRRSQEAWESYTMISLGGRHWHSAIPAESALDARGDIPIYGRADATPKLPNLKRRILEFGLCGQPDEPSPMNASRKGRESCRPKVDLSVRSQTHPRGPYSQRSVLVRSETVHPVRRGEKALRHVHFVSRSPVSCCLGLPHRLMDRAPSYNDDPGAPVN